MLKCRECGCNCDPGDLINGVCDDCRERNKKMAGIWLRPINDSAKRQERFGQMDLRDYVLYMGGQKNEND